MNINMKEIVKNTSIYSFGRLASKAIGFLMIPLYTSFLTPADYGIFELLTMLVMILGIMIQGGISSAMFKFYNSCEDKSDKKEYISTIFIFVNVVCFVLCILSSLFSGYLSYALFADGKYGYHVILMLISFFFSIVTTVPETYLMVQKKSKQYAIMSLVLLFISLSLNIYFVAFAKLAVLGVLYASIIARILHAAYLMKITLPEIGLKFDINKLKTVLTFSIPMIPAELGMFVFACSDRFFLSHMSNLSEVGIYSLGYKFAFMLSFLVIQPFMQVWEQEMYEISGKEGAETIFGRIYIYLVCAVMFSGLLMSVFIKEVIELVATSQFHSAWKVVPFIALAYVFRASYYYFRMAMFIKSKTLSLSKVTVIGALFSLLLNYILIPRYGAIGASIATLCSYFILSATTFVLSQKLVKMRIESVNLCKIMLISLVTFIVYSKITLDFVILTMLLKTTSIPLLLVFVWLSGIFTEEEKLKMKDMVFQKLTRAKIG